jgi:hypothetical protein
MAEAGDVKTLEQRVRMLEDRLEIYNLIASHPPSADTGAGRLHRLGLDRGQRIRPRCRIRAADRTGGDRCRLVEPRAPSGDRAGDRAFRRLALKITGDTAFAITYLQILVPDRVGPLFDVPNHGSSRGFHVHRVSANRWDFVRTTEGWKITRRTLRPLDGSAPAREILGGALEP